MNNMGTYILFKVEEFLLLLNIQTWAEFNYLQQLQNTKEPTAGKTLGTRISISTEVQTLEPRCVGTGEGGFYLILLGDTFLVLLIKAIHKWLGKCLWSEAIWETCEMEH